MPLSWRHNLLLNPNRTAVDRVHLRPMSLLSILTEHGGRVTYRSLSNLQTAPSPQGLIPSWITGTLSVNLSFPIYFHFDWYFLCVYFLNKLQIFLLFLPESFLLLTLSILLEVDHDAQATVYFLSSFLQQIN